MREDPEEKKEESFYIFLDSHARVLAQNDVVVLDPSLLSCRSLLAKQERRDDNRLRDDNGLTVMVKRATL